MGGLRRCCGPPAAHPRTAAILGAMLGSSLPWSDWVLWIRHHGVTLFDYLDPSSPSHTTITFVYRPSRGGHRLFPLPSPRACLWGTFSINIRDTNAKAEGVCSGKMMLFMRVADSENETKLGGSSATLLIPGFSGYILVGNAFFARLVLVADTLFCGSWGNDKDIMSEPA